MVHKSYKAIPLCQGRKRLLCQTEADYYTSAGGDKSSQITTFSADARFKRKVLLRRPCHHQRSHRAELDRHFSLFLNKNLPENEKSPSFTCLACCAFIRFSKKLRPSILSTVAVLWTSTVFKILNWSR